MTQEQAREAVVTAVRRWSREPRSAVVSSIERDNRLMRVFLAYENAALDAVRADAAPVDSLDQRAWFMPPDLIDGEAWTREVAVVEMGTATAPYWWVICPQATTLVFAHDLDRHPMRGNGGDDCSAAGCEWDKPHAWAKTVLDERRHPRVAAPVPPVDELNIDMQALIEKALTPTPHPFVDTQAGVPSLLQRIGAPCGQCSRPGGDPIHRVPPVESEEAGSGDAR